MSKNVVVISFIVCLLNGVSAMPQDNVGKVVEEASGGLPFLQFKDGGVRVNFAGFHAAAGLGGILTGSRTGGGLHASAGTPWGANAAAGLGGLLSGDNANAGGGLYARAGLGDGLPEARAGLGGALDGSGRSERPVSGGLFAGATTGGRTSADSGAYGSAGAYGGSDGGSPPSYAAATGNAFAGADAGAKAKKHSTNIQIVARSQQKSQKSNEGVETINLGTNGQVDSARKPEVQNLKVQNEGHQSYSGLSASAGLFGAITPDSAIVKKVKIADAAIVPNDNSPPQFAAAEKHAGAVFDNNVYTMEKPIRARWYVRKRLRAGIPRKQIIYSSEFNAPAAPPNPSILARTASDVSAAGSATATVYKSVHTGSLFDDIFNIPISTLTAVNQLLKNNVG